MQVSLSPETQKLLKSRMRKSGYQTPEDAIRATLEAIDPQVRRGDFAPGELEALIQEGEQSSAEEGTVDGDEAFRVRQKQRQALRAKSK